MKFLNTYAGQNWLITPAALAVGERPPASIYDQKWLLVLSGVVLADLKGNLGDQWLRETLEFLPDMAGPSNSGPLNWAINRFSIPRPATPPDTYWIGFSLEEWAPFATLSAISNERETIESINFGFAVDKWRARPFDTATNALTHLPVNQVFTGIRADVAVRDVDARILRISYNITLLGRIVFLENVLV